MEITPTQIKIIDNCLKKKGIKYWDLRIEMVDHIISDIEQHALTNNFKVELESSLKRIGWNGNLRNENISGWQNVNRKYRKEYGKELLSFLSSHKKLFSLIIFLIFLWTLSSIIELALFKKIIGFSFIFLFAIFLYFNLKSKVYKYGKSVNLDYGVFYFSFIFLMFNLPFQLSRHLTEEYQKSLLIFTTPIFLIGFYAGYNVFKKAISKVEKMKKQMAL